MESYRFPVVNMLDQEFAAAPTVAKAEGVTVSPALSASLLNCLTCKRTLLPWSVFANGYTDGPTTCHSCKEKRNHEAEIELNEAGPED